MFVLACVCSAATAVAAFLVISKLKLPLLVPWLIAVHNLSLILSLSLSLSIYLLSVSLLSSLSSLATALESGKATSEASCVAWALLGLCRGVGIVRRQPLP